jgi:LPLT family lysophospholipid transporter-like MFS transporter
VLAWVRQRAFFSLVAAQFFSSLADSALLIAAIGLLLEQHAAGWMAPALRVFFYFPYLLLAAFAGAVADYFPKGRVMFGTNLVKLGGCALLLAQVHPLFAYGVVGFGAAAYSPAKYGILPELFAPAALVGANAWIEVSTVVSILLGVGLGSFLIAPGSTVPHLLAAPAANATLLISVLYGIAAVFAAAIPHSTARAVVPIAHPWRLLREFRRALCVLWRDPQGQISLAVTSLFWGASATLQFLILSWAAQALGLPLAEAALLQIAVALGMVLGAMAAARWISLHRTLRLLPTGVAIGVAVLLMTLVTQVWVAATLLLVIGVLAGLFIVPMNALLQHRGQALMHAGQTIAVQNFNENMASLAMLAVYGVLLYLDAPISAIVIGFGVFVTLAMLLIVARHGVIRYRLSAVSACGSVR